ncbi:PE family protein [Mycobacterium kansasii]|uniref:PE family protein n=1 Tax=Mycobacterium kansasii TaxID=1768 RepID=UPI0009EF6F68|nr:PE family protein [Mycobacterium kansasii]ARG58372.1 hypothetical protein B1T43_23945 [Mycobacterium kansasii]
MSYVIAGPAAIAAAATELAGIGSTIGQANVNAAAMTAGVPAAAADQVSAAVAAFFAAQAQGYQGISAQMAAFHDRLVQALSAGGAAYAGAEAASAQNLLDLINAPALALFGRPGIGNGADGGERVLKKKKKITKPASCCMATAGRAEPAGPGWLPPPSAAWAGSAATPGCSAAAGPAARAATTLSTSVAKAAWAATAAVAERFSATVASAVAAATAAPPAEPPGTAGSPGTRAGAGGGRGEATAGIPGPFLRF